jgi:hypothetical protein
MTPSYLSYQRQSRPLCCYQNSHPSFFSYCNGDLMFVGQIEVEICVWLVVGVSTGAQSLGNFGMLWCLTV